MLKEELGTKDFYGNKDKVRLTLELLATKVLEKNKWFSVCTGVDKNQVDLMSIGKEQGKKTLGRVLADLRPDEQYRVAVYKYLLKNYLCYVESPLITYKTKEGKELNTYEKFLATANLDVMREWLDCTQEEVDKKYKSRVYHFDENEDVEVPYVKLTESKEKVRKITKPRKDLDISKKGTRVVPLFLLDKGVTYLYNFIKNSDKPVEVSFQKDNKTIRSIVTTFNEKLLADTYGKDSRFYVECTQKMFGGDFKHQAVLTRGYIRVPEFGGSKFDNPLRSINYSRIVSINTDPVVDLSYIDVDLSKVEGNFTNYILRNPNELGNIIGVLQGFGLWTEEDSKKYRMDNMSDMLRWVEDKKFLYSTVFVRNLYLVSETLGINYVKDESKVEDMDDLLIDDDVDDIFNI